MRLRRKVAKNMKKRLVVITCLLILSACIVVPFARLGGPGFGGIGSVSTRETMAHPAKLGGPGFGGVGDTPNIAKNVLSFGQDNHSQSYQLLSARISFSHPKSRKHGVGLNAYTYDICDGGEPIGDSVSRTYSDGLTITVELCYDRFSKYNYSAVDGFNDFGWSDGWIETWRLSGPDGGATHDAASVEFTSNWRTQYDNGVYSPNNRARACFVPQFPDVWTCTNYY